MFDGPVGQYRRAVLITHRNAATATMGTTCKRHPWLKTSSLYKRKSGGLRVDDTSLGDDCKHTGEHDKICVSYRGYLETSRGRVKNPSSKSC